MTRREAFVRLGDSSVQPRKIWPKFNLFSESWHDICEVSMSEHLYGIATEIAFSIMRSSATPEIHLFAK